MDNANYKAQMVAAAQAAVDAAQAKVAKAEAHLAGACEAVKVATGELERVKAVDYVWEEPQEHVIVRVR